MTWAPPSRDVQENTEIPEEVINAVKAEFKKARVQTRGQIGHLKVREYLRKLKLQN